MNSKKELLELCEKIFETKKPETILINLKNEIAAVLGVRRAVIYLVDGKRNQLVSLFKSGEKIKEYRIPISLKNIAGFCAVKQKILNIKDCYDEKELKSISAELEFDQTEDNRDRIRTKESIVCPIVYDELILGVLQAAGSISGKSFDESDEKAVSKLAEIIGTALYNQKNSAKIKAPFVSLNSDTKVASDVLIKVKLPFLKKNLWVPLESDNGETIIAIDDPNDFERVNDIKSILADKDIRFRAALKEDILTLLESVEKKSENISYPVSREPYFEDEDVSDYEVKDKNDAAVVKLLDKIISDSHAKRASDIHFEPRSRGNGIGIRLRVDGICYDYKNIPEVYKEPLISRIKIMSGLDISERRKPQDGKIKFKDQKGNNIDLRVAIMPTQSGFEDIVIRILPLGELRSLDKLGLTKKNSENFIKSIAKPYGLVLVCGPTGSGKTTSLHSALNYINNSEKKIWTAEDPVEITQKGLRQVQVAPDIGFNFAAAMRGFLRADPDVIMIGEMRDKETASIVIESSLTGHLVFSTLHTNSAAESIVRLLEMGMDPYNFADSILCILGQRLVRTLCKECMEPFNPPKELYEQLIHEYGEEDFQKNLDIPYTDVLMLNKATGCMKCGETGYSGRMGIHELLVVTDEMKQLIRKKAGIDKITAQALKDGMTTLKQDGIGKIFMGYLDLLQVRKVCI